MHVTVENASHLNETDQVSVHYIRDNAAGSLAGLTLDQAASKLRAFLGADWLVYLGGHHIGVHRTLNDDRRVLLVTEKS